MRGVKTGFAEAGVRSESSGPPTHLYGTERDNVLWK
jgi:hypothetical protein